MSTNLFRGAQPYRRDDEGIFFGRDEVTRKLANRVLGHPCITVFGPSGAGKSSVMRAGVIPRLAKGHDFRVVSIEGWLKDEVPLQRLVLTLFQELGLGEPPVELSPARGVELALELAERRSDRPILLYLDQLEQLLQPGRDAAQADELLKSLQGLARRPQRGLQLVLALREDYLGLFRDRARGRRELLEQGFRLTPLTVGEMARVVCQIAEASRKTAGKGEPTQAPWSEEELRGLLRQVRVAGPDPVNLDDAEVQAAYAQIVCRMLWEIRRRGVTPRPLLAQPMLDQYLETTLDGLGPVLKAHAQVLLRESLIDSDGSRLLLTEKKARKALEKLSDEDASKVLMHLVDAAVLHRQPYQNNQYYELGHDWLAKKVLELRKERELHEERAARRKLKFRAVGAAVAALLMFGLLIWGLWERHNAAEAEVQVRDNGSMTGVRELIEINKLDMASKLLLEVRKPEAARGWQDFALKVLRTGASAVTLPCPEATTEVAFSPDGQHVAIVCQEKTVLVWKADGTGRPVELPHEGTVEAVAFSPDGQRVLTRSASTARVWKVDGSALLEVPKGKRVIRSADFSPDGRFVLTTWEDDGARIYAADKPAPPVVLTHEAGNYSANFSPDGRSVLALWSQHPVVVIWKADGSGQPVLLRHEKEIISADFSPDGRHVLTNSADGIRRVWRADGAAPPVQLKHDEPFGLTRFSPDGLHVLTYSPGAVLRWKADGSGPPEKLEHKRSVSSADFSPDGQIIMTTSSDDTIQLWKASDLTRLRKFEHEGALRTASFSPDGRSILALSYKNTVHVWKTDGSDKPVVLWHERDIVSAVFSPDSRFVLTVAEDDTARMWKVAGPVRQVAPRCCHQTLTDRINSFNRSTWDFGTPLLWKFDSLGQASVIRETGWGSIYRRWSFSPDGQFVVTASGNDAVVWSARGGGEPVVLSHERPVTSEVFSPDGRFLATTFGAKEALIWKADGSGKPTVFKHPAVVTSAAFSPDGRLLVTISDDNAVRIWKADGAEKPVVLPHQGLVASAAFSPDSQSIVTTSGDREALIWKADGSGQPVVLEHEKAVTSAVFNPDGRSLVTLSGPPQKLWGGEIVLSHDTVHVWKADGSGQPASFQADNESPFLSVAFQRDGKYMLITSADGTLQVRNANGLGNPLVRDRVPQLTSAAFTEDGRYLITTIAGKTVRLRHFQEQLATPSQPTPGMVYTLMAVPELELHRSSAAFSPDSQWVAASFPDRTVQVVRIDGSGPPVVLQGQEVSATSIAFSPDGRSILTTALDNKLRVWKLDGSGKPVVRPYEGVLTSAAFSPDSQSVIATSVDNTARMWKADDLSPLEVFQHEAPVFSATFGPEGKTVLTTTYDGARWVWNVDGSGGEPAPEGERREASRRVSPDGQLVLEISRDTVSVKKVDGSGTPVVLSKGRRLTVATFSPDGRTVLLAGDDTVWLKSADGLGQQAKFQAEGTIASADFSPDGRYIMVHLEDRVQLLPSSIPEFQKLLRDTFKECLTPEMRQTYLFEDSRTAEAQHAACERFYGRQPLVQATP